MHSCSPPRVERLHNAEPLLQKIDDHPWENKVIFNPACVLITNRHDLNAMVMNLPFDESTKHRMLSHAALCFMLYRENDYEDLGVEDPRVTKVSGRYVMFYTAYKSGSPRNTFRIACASSTDLLNWKKHGLLKGKFNEIDNKDAMLFESPVGDMYFMLHRPTEGKDAMAIHWAEADDLFGTWNTRGVLMRPIPNPSFADTWIGGGAPPLQLPDGRFLMLYHIGNRKADGTKQYDLGIAVIDPTGRQPVVKRDEPLLRPETPAEITGDPDLGVNNVTFVCGAYFYDWGLVFPYAGADTVILGGKIPRGELGRYLAP